MKTENRRQEPERIGGGKWQKNRWEVEVVRRRTLGGKCSMLIFVTN